MSNSMGVTIHVTLGVSLSHYYFLGWSGTEQPIAEATIWPIEPAPATDECAPMGGMLGRGN